MGLKKAEHAPHRDVKLDCYSHWPIDKKNQKQEPGCKGFTSYNVQNVK